MVDCCANTSLMRARPDSLLHCMAKTSLMRAFFSAQVLALCPFEKCMGTLYHNRAPTQEKFCAAQRRAVRSEAFPALHDFEQFAAQPPRPTKVSEKGRGADNRPVMRPSVLRT